jgi:hypothetical protein
LLYLQAENITQEGKMASNNRINTLYHYLYLRLIYFQLYLLTYIFHLFGLWLLWYQGWYWHTLGWGFLAASLATLENKATDPRNCTDWSWISPPVRNAYLNRNKTNGTNEKGAKRVINELILWNRVVLEKLTVTQPVKKWSAFYEAQKFIIIFTTDHYWILFGCQMHLTHIFMFQCFSILILSFHWYSCTIRN